MALMALWATTIPAHGSSMQFITVGRGLTDWILLTVSTQRGLPALNAEAVPPAAVPHGSSPVQPDYSTPRQRIDHRRKGRATP